MARRTPRPPPTPPQTLSPLLRPCPLCGTTLWAASPHSRTSTTRTAVGRLTLQSRRGLPPGGPQFPPPDRPEEAGRWALSTPEVGREVLALVGALRSAPHRRLPAMPQALRGRRRRRAPRTGPPLRARSDARVARALADPRRLQQLPQAPGRLLLALDGWPPDVGQEGRWGRRAGRAAARLLARRRRSAPQAALAALRAAVRQALGVPMVGVRSDGQPALRGAGEQAWPTVPHPLGHLPSRRAAAQAVSAADRHAQQARQTRGRGGRPLDRPRDTCTAPAAAGRRGDGRAVRRARTEEGPPPRVASGLQLPDRLEAMAERRERGEHRGPGPRPARGCRPSAGGA